MCRFTFKQLRTSQTYTIKKVYKHPKYEYLPPRDVAGDGILMETFYAYYSDGTVYTPYAEGVTDLLERGFGTLKGKKLILSPYECFFLKEKGRISVFEKKTERARQRIFKEEEGDMDQIFGLQGSKGEGLHC
jgi:hypothetical protein